MDVKKIIAKVCNRQYENVEQLLNNEIAKIQEMRLFAKIVHLAEEFSYELKDNMGKTISFEIGYESDRIPQSTTIFYKLDKQSKHRFQVEDGAELLHLLQFSKGRASGSLLIDHSFKERMIILILGEKLSEKYFETYFEMRF